MTSAEALAAHYPLVYGELKDTMGALCSHHPHLTRPFPSYSIYPGCAFNLGPRTVSFKHRDPGNIPRVPCAISALGPFDPDKGGHLVLDDLKIIIRFPPGSTILISSASLRHGNIPIQEGEKRYSITQFCPGGLYRWVRHGFRPVNKLSKREHQALDGNPTVRWNEGWALLSTPETLKAHRLALVEKETREASVEQSVD